MESLKAFTFNRCGILGPRNRKLFEAIFEEWLRGELLRLTEKLVNQNRLIEKKRYMKSREICKQAAK